MGRRVRPPGRRVTVVEGLLSGARTLPDRHRHFNTGLVERLRERRDQARHPSYAKPELVATAPNQIWSWDITKLKGPIPYLYYSLYVILDLFSRYVVGWMVAAQEDRKSTRLNSSHSAKSRMPSSA